MTNAEQGRTAEGRGRGISRATGGRYVPRFAGEAFAHEGNPDDGPVARRHTSQVEWKRPPSANLRAQVST